jgi:transcriptional regulator with XRE-family HTH domain
MASPEGRSVMDAALSNHLGASVRAARRRKGLTQAQAARGALLATAVYGRIERGQLMPGVSTLPRLCHALDVEPNALLGFLSRSPPPWFTRVKPSRPPLAVRHLLRTAGRLRPRQLRALGMLALALLDNPRPPRGARASRV